MAKMKARLAMLKRKQEKMVKAMMKRQDEWKKQMLVKKSVAKQKAQLLRAQALRDARLLEEKRQRLLCVCYFLSLVPPLSLSRPNHSLTHRCPNNSAVRKQQERERENQNQNRAKSLSDKRQKEENKRHIQAVMDHRLSQRRAQRIKVQNNKSSAKSTALRRKRKVRERQKEEYALARKREDEEHSALLIELEKMRKQEAQMMHNLNGLAEMSLNFDEDLQQMEAEIEENLQNEIAAANREREKIEERYQELLLEFTTTSSKAGSKAGSSAPSPTGFSMTPRNGVATGEGGSETVSDGGIAQDEDFREENGAYVDMDPEKLALFTKVPPAKLNRDDVQERVRRLSSAKQSSVLVALDSHRSSITLEQALEATKVISSVQSEPNHHADLEADPCSS